MVGCGDTSKTSKVQDKPVKKPSAEGPAPKAKIAQQPAKVEAAKGEGARGASGAVGDALSASVVLPPASRVFTVDIDGDGADEILGSKAGTLWAHRIHKTGGTSLMWSVDGEGTVHRILMTPENGTAKPRLLCTAAVDD